MIDGIAIRGAQAQRIYLCRACFVSCDALYGTAVRSERQRTLRMYFPIKNERHLILITSPIYI